MLQADRMSQSRRSNSNSRLRSNASNNLHGTRTRPKTLSSPLNRARDALLLELVRFYPLSHTDLFEPPELQQIEDLSLTRDTRTLRGVVVNALKVYRQDLTDFIDQLWNSTPTKSDIYKRLRHSWRLYVHLVPLARGEVDFEPAVDPETGGSIYNRFSESPYALNLPSHDTFPDAPPPHLFKISLGLQDSLEQLHRLIRPVICTICHGKVPTWSFYEHTNVCFELENGKRNLLEVNAEIFKLCEEAEAEVNKLDMRSMPCNLAQLETEIFGVNRADNLISTYKRSQVSSHSGNSNFSPSKKNSTPDQNSRQPLAGLMKSVEGTKPSRNDLDSHPSPVDSRDRDRDSKRFSQIALNEPKNPNFLRAIALHNGIRLGKGSSDGDPVRIASMDPRDIGGSVGGSDTGGSLGFKSQNVSRKNSAFRADSCGFNPDEKVESNYELPTEKQLLFPANRKLSIKFDSNSDPKSEKKTSPIQPTNSDPDGDGELVGDAFWGAEGSHHSTNSFGENEHNSGSNDLQLTDSLQRKKDSVSKHLGVIDEEEEVLASRKVLKQHLLADKNAQNDNDPSSKSISPELPTQPLEFSRIDSRTLGAGFDSSARVLPVPFTPPKECTITGPKEPLNPFKAQIDGGSSNLSVEGSRESSNRQTSLDRNLAPAAGGVQSQSVDGPNRFDSTGSLIPKDSVNSAFKKSYRGFHNQDKHDSPYVKPRIQREDPDTPKPFESSADPRPNARPNAFRFAYPTEYKTNKSKFGLDFLGSFRPTSNQKISVPGRPPEPFNTSSTFLNDFMAIQSRRLPPGSPHSTTLQKNSVQPTEATGNHNEFALLSRQNLPTSFPSSSTDYKPRVSLNPPASKPLERKKVPFEVRRAIWAKANRAATEYRKPEPQKKDCEDHLVFLLNKRIQAYKATLQTSTLIINYRAEKDLIFDLGLARERFKQPLHRSFIDRLMEAIKHRIEMVEKQCKKQNQMTDLSLQPRQRKLVRNKMSLSMTDLRPLDHATANRHKALTALNLEFVSGILTKKVSYKDPPMPSFLAKLMQKEDSSTVREKTPDGDDKRTAAVTIHKVDSRSEADRSRVALPDAADTSIDHELSIIQSDKSKEDCDIGDYFASESPPPEKPKLLLASAIRSIKPSPTVVIPPNRRVQTVPESLGGDATVLPRGLRKHPSDSNLMIIGEREKMYFEQNRDHSLENFELLREVGKGAFGRVFLAMHKPTKEIFALKVIQFQEQVSKKFLTELQNEIGILAVIEGDFLAKAFFSFVDRQCLCIAMEYLVGGDFRAVLETEGRFDEPVARWYTAQLCLAVEELHSRGIVHRDLKPENILLDKDMKLKLADFGLSEFRKRVEETGGLGANDLDTRHKTPATKQKSKTIVGTPDYIPPEVILAAELTSDRRLGGTLKNTFGAIPSHNNGSDLGNTAMPGTGSPIHSNANSPDIDRKAFFLPDAEIIVSAKRTGSDQDLNALDTFSSAIDWWGVGCLLYEFLVGVSPFGGQSVAEVFDNIKNFKIDWPEIGHGEDCVTPEAQDLILRFLDRDPLKRIGVKSFKDIQAHPFFRDLDWSTLATAKAPFTLDVSKAPTASKKIKMSTIMPRKPNPTGYKFNTQDFVISRLDLFYELNIKKLLQLR